MQTFRLALPLVLWITACGGNPDQGSPADSTAEEGGVDAGASDGTPDALADSSSPDSGAVDSGPVDAPKPVVGKKWFPGHYLFLRADTSAVGSRELTVLKGVDGGLFRGLFTYVTWGQIETTKGTYHWEKIDALLAALPPGKKLSVALSWQQWNTEITPLQACPADMIGGAEYDGGQRFRDATPYSTIYMTATMTRYLDWVKKFAARYDKDERLAFATTAEIPFESSLRGPAYDGSTAISNMMRLPKEMFPEFKQTPVGVLGAWWAFGGGLAAQNAFAKAVYDSGSGFGFPDLLGPGSDNYASQFRDEVTTRAGTWASWMGMEFSDYVPPRALTPFPEKQLASSMTTKTNFIWWGTYDRTAAGGHAFADDVLPVLRKDPLAGITTICPTNMVCLP